MNAEQENKGKNFIKSPWGKVALGAGLAGAVGLTAIMLIKNKRSHADAEVLKKIARDAAVATDDIATVVNSAEAFAQLVGPKETADVTTGLANLVEKGPVQDILFAMAATANPSPSKNLHKPRRGVALSIISKRFLH